VSVTPKPAATLQLSYKPNLSYRLWKPNKSLASNLSKWDVEDEGEAAALEADDPVVGGDEDDGDKPLSLAG